MHRHHLLLLLLLLVSVACAQVSGEVRDQPISDLTPDKVIERAELKERAALRQLGVLTIEGSILMDREDVEQIARGVACEHGAAYVTLSHERYGTPFIGSSARATLWL